MLSLLVGGTDVFTGDTLFKGSVGGVRAPGSTSYDDLKHSIMEVLLAPRQIRTNPLVRNSSPTVVGSVWPGRIVVSGGSASSATHSCGSTTTWCRRTCA